MLEIIYLNYLHPPHFAGLQPDLDAARVDGLARKNIFDHAAGQAAGGLVFFFNNKNRQARFNVFSLGGVHFIFSR